jgi:hypothetical protein
VFRSLYLEEIPMTLGAMFGQDSVLAVIGDNEDQASREAFRAIARSWGLGDRVRDEAEVSGNALHEQYVWLLGSGTMLTTLLDALSDQVEVTDQVVTVDGAPFGLPGNTLICTLRNPYNQEMGLAFVLSKNLASLQMQASRIPHYSRYSYVGFEGQQPTLKGVWKEARSPLTIDFVER